MSKSTLLKCSKAGLFCGMLFSISLCTAQQAPDFVYKAPPASLFDTTAKRTPQSQMDTLIGSALDATTYLPANYVKDGSVDYTQYLQKALNMKLRVVMPDFPVLVNQNGLSIQSNAIVIFNRHSAILLAPTSAASYNILKIHEVKNVTVYDPVIIGDRKQHSGTKGEWGMGLSIRGSSNVVIYNPNVSNCWGDGIYIADMGESRAENVTIYNARLDFNRRNGISIVSGKNLKIIDPIATNTAGTNPQAGIDIEPNTNHDILEGVDIEHPITFNNGVSGILISLPRLVGKDQKNVGIDINNFVDERSKQGLEIYGFFDHYDNGQPLGGQINISNPTLIDNKTPFLGRSHYETGPNTQITNMSTKKRDGNGNLVNDSASAKNVKKKFSGVQKLNFN